MAHETLPLAVSGLVIQGLRFSRRSSNLYESANSGTYDGDTATTCLRTTNNRPDLVTNATRALRATWVGTQARQHENTPARVVEYT